MRSTGSAEGGGCGDPGPAGRKIITTHDAFGHSGAAYGVAFIALQGVLTESQVSARDVAKIITQIRRRKSRRCSSGNGLTPACSSALARESGARIGGIALFGRTDRREGS